MTTNIEEDSLLNELFNNKLNNTNKFERDKGIDLIKCLLLENEKYLEIIRNKILEFIGHDQQIWTFNYGLLCALKELLDHEHSKVNNEFVEKIKKFLINALEYKKEARIRLIAGEIFGQLCAKSPLLFRQIEPHLINLLQIYLNGDLKRREAKRLYKKTIYGEDFSDSGSDSSGNDDNDEPILDEYENDEAEVIKKLSLNTKTGAIKLYRVIAGWKHLETSMKAFQHSIEGNSKAKNEFNIEKEALGIIFQTCNNKNRHIRDASFSLLNSILATNLIELDTTSLQIISRHLSFGLSDNWSHVRLAASIATRNFLLNKSQNEEFLNNLLPCMCLNRYYSAEGVKLYSQDTWVLVFKTNGKFYVEKHLCNVVDYYLKQVNVRNTVTREAACAAISELFSKIDKNLLKVHLDTLFKSLSNCFDCESWTVRDASCLAIGSMFLNYIEELNEEDLKKSIDICLTNLKSTLQSVRQGAAISLSNLIKTCSENDDKIKQFLDLFEAGFNNTIELTSVKKQNEREPNRIIKSLSSSCEDDIGMILLESSSESWCLADGYLYLFFEISSVNKKIIKNFMIKQFDLMLKLIKIRNYSQHVYIMETFCKLECNFEPAEYAASECLFNLSQYIGPNILLGRIENFDSRYVDKFQRVLTNKSRK